MPTDLPKHLLRLLVALLKHQARTWLGEEALGVAGETFAEIGGEELQARLDAWLRAETTAAELRRAAQTADRYFQEHCDDPALLQALTLDFGTLPAVQQALAELPQALDPGGVEATLREALGRDLGRALTGAQIAHGARLYAEALQAAVGTLRDFTLPVLLQIALQVRTEQREGFAAVQQKLDHILALLEAGRSLSAEQAALLQEALLRGQVVVLGDVAHSVILIGHHNTVTLNEAQAAALKPQVTLPGDLPPGSYLPLTRNALFTGRAPALARLAAALLPADGWEAEAVVVTQAITGLGGVGKTQLAVEFAYRHGYRFRGVHWLDLSDPALLDEQIAHCGEEMGLRQGPDEERPAFARRVVERWKADGPRLLLLDSLEDPQAAQEVLNRLRHSSLRLLLTARRRDWPHHLGLDLLPLDEFSPEESRAFLRRYLPPERAADEDLDALAGRLGHLPLALELAGRYMAHQPYLRVAEYLARLEDVFAHRSMTGWREDLPSPTKHDLDLWATFELSWRQVKGEHARRLFWACGFLAPNTPVPQAILQLLVPDPEDLGEAVGELVGLGLLKDGPAIHPLLAEFARHLTPTPQPPSPLPMGEGKGVPLGAQRAAPPAAGEGVRFLPALADLAEETNHEVGRTGNYALYAPLLPHVRAAAAHAEHLDPPAACGTAWATTCTTWPSMPGRGRALSGRCALTKPPSAPTTPM